MPTLIFTTSTTRRGAAISGRLLIGRRLPMGLSLNDPAVSRLHAWIDPASDAGWQLIDAGSKTGTFVNDQKITRQHLRDGDQIRVGQTILAYHDADELPADVAEVRLTAPPAAPEVTGILFDCACGSPLWVQSELAGKRGLCRHCRQPVTVPIPQPPPPSPAPASTGVGGKKTGKCAVCHSPILPTEPAVQCADCAMLFHAECWQENLGCSSYGCPQVEALKPREEPAMESPAAAAAEPPPAHRTPWDLVLLAASVIGSVVGALAFGALAAIVAITAAILLIRRRYRPMLLVLAIGISLAGVAGGLAVSDFWYFNARHIPAGWLRH